MNGPSEANRRKVLKTIAGIGLSIGALSGTAGADQRGLKQELAEVRSATASYNNTANAEADGYHAEDEPPVCGMGHHYVNMGLVDFTVNKLEPEGMVYGESDGGNLNLGAVEYIVPKAGQYAEDPPTDPFDHADPDWGVLELPPEAPVPFSALWTLHAWVHTKNPDGVFNPTNPRKQFSPDGCVSH